MAGISLPIPVQFNGHSRNVCLQVSPLDAGPSSRRALILFIEGGPASMPVDSAGLSEAQGNADLVVKRLQEELLATRANLKVSRQQFETATENLRAANEELQSINEEYRSTAEELETSREELQSMKRRASER
jgi:two-component system CheB/CheR fusion protein